MMMAAPPPSKEGGRLGSRDAQPQQADGSKLQLPRFYQAALMQPREDVVVS